MLTRAIKVFGNGSLGANVEQVRLIKDVEVDKLNFNDFDGFNKLQPAYSI